MGGGGDGVSPVLKHLQSLRHPSVCECSIGLFRLISVNPVNYDSKERSTEVHVVYPFPLFGNPVSPHTDGSHFVMEKGCFEERFLSFVL